MLAFAFKKVSIILNVYFNLKHLSSFCRARVSWAKIYGRLFGRPCVTTCQALGPGGAGRGEGP